MLSFVSLEALRIYQGHGRSAQDDSKTDAHPFVLTSGVGWGLYGPPSPFGCLSNPATDLVRSPA
jgi:hypothetical protein